MTTRERILEYLVNYISDFGYPPTIREIAKGVGIASNSTVTDHLMRMERDGLIERGALGETRAIKVVGYKFVPESEDA